MHSPHPWVVLTRTNAPLRASGFTLVEVALALGITALACVVVVSLFSSGLYNFDQSQNRAATARIAQSLTNEVSQSDWTSLFPNGGTAPQTLPVRYYDQQGEEVTAAAATPPPQTVYVAQPLLYVPDATHTGGVDYSATTLGAPEFLRVVVRVLNLPGGQASWFTSSDPTKWTPPQGQSDRLAVFPFMVSRNAHSPN